MDTAVYLAVVGFVAISSTSTVFADGLVVKVAPKRLERLSKGANVTQWFRFPASTSDAYLGSYISDAEMKAMRRMGLRHVRLAISPHLIMDYPTGNANARELKFVERAIDRFIANDLAVVVSMHDTDSMLEKDPQWQTNFVRLWRIVAKRLKTRNPDMVFLEVVNEPAFDHKEDQWIRLNKRLTVAIRESAPKNTIIVSGPHWGDVYGLRKMKPLPDYNIVYTFHFYEPTPFTHQGATWMGDAIKPLRNVPYPSSPEAVSPLLDNLPQASQDLLKGYGYERWNATKLESTLAAASEWGLRNNVPLYCGEFGVYPKYAPAQSRASWLRDFAQAISSSKIGWCTWGWDDSFGLGRVKDGNRFKVDETVTKILNLKNP